MAPRWRLPGEAEGSVLGSQSRPQGHGEARKVPARPALRRRGPLRHRLHSSAGHHRPPELGARTTPRSSMVPIGYVAISRARGADDLTITQPFSPMLFRQGHQTGPWLLRAFTAGEMTTEQTRAGWAEAEKEAAS
eukprot:7028270-Pyramimonas_sp.AAC.1